MFTSQPDCPSPSPGICLKLAAASLALILLGSWYAPSTAADSHPTVSLSLPTGKWKAIRLRNLPKDTVVSVALQSDGALSVGFLTTPDHARFPKMAKPLFWGQTESKLGFSVTIQEKGDYYVVLENREGDRPRQITLRTTARRLMETFQDKTQAADALVYSMFEEMAKLFQSQWDLGADDPVFSLDELTTVLTLTFRLDANVRAYSQTIINQPETSNSLSELFHDPLHPLTPDRAQQVLKWATDPELVRNWQPTLVPHMQTRMLEHLIKHPQPWSDQNLIEKELAVRAARSPDHKPFTAPKEKIKA